MKLIETVGLDPNQLPYLVADSSGAKIPVTFALLTAADKGELSGADWLGAVFREGWIGFCGEARTRKLIAIGSDSPIMGLLRLGAVPEGGKSLQRSLLETAPALRFRTGSVSPLRGVGRVLVARLVMESYNQGGNGAVQVASHDGAFDFYRRIGFVQVRYPSNVFRLSQEAAEILFERAT